MLSGQQCYGRVRRLPLVQLLRGQAGQNRGSRGYFGVFPELLLQSVCEQVQVIGTPGGHRLPAAIVGSAYPQKGRALLRELSNSEGEKLRKSRAIRR